MERRCPLLPQRRTFAKATVTSALCQQETHAPQQLAANSTLVSRRNGLGGLPLVRPRQYDLELGEKPGLCLDIDAATVLLDDYVVAHRQAKPGTFA